MNLQIGAWGGGNQFGHSLCNFLRKKGCQVSHDLKNPDLDIVILTEPRTNLKSSAYSHEDIINYLKYRNPTVIIVHRINECDERKGTENVNELLMEANRCADYTVFISSFLQNLFIAKGFKSSTSSVILNGGTREIFHGTEGEKWSGNGPVNIVTHHWGDNWLKGFDIYKKLDEMLSQKKWKKLISFTYIGHLPDGFQFKNAELIEPLNGTVLADKIRQNHVYLTASRNEPAGMHHIEGALCGLPLLYIESGALPEYCNGFGISFTPNNFIDKLKEMIDNYGYWVDKMPGYPHTAEKMCSEYYSIIKNLIKNREEIIAQRKLDLNPTLLERSSYHLNSIKDGMKRSAGRNIRKLIK